MDENTSSDLSEQFWALIFQLCGFLAVIILLFQDNTLSCILSLLFS